MDNVPADSLLRTLEWLLQDVLLQPRASAANMYSQVTAQTNRTYSVEITLSQFP